MLLRRLALLAGAAVLAALAALLLLAARDSAAQQLTIGNLRALDFGRFVAGSGGAITISPTGLRSRTGAVVLLNSPSTGQAMFSVGRSGSEEGKAIVISLPPNGSTLLSSGSASMAVNAFVLEPASLVSIPAGGATLSVGATLVVAPDQAPGNYTGTFSLIVNYQ